MIRKMEASPSSDSAALVEFAGEYDLASKEMLQAALAFLEDAKTAVLDFSKVTYIDSTVLTELVLLQQKRAGNGLDRPTLVLQNPAIRRLLQIVSMTDLFRIVATRSEALGERGDTVVVRHAGSFA